MCSKCFQKVPSDLGKSTHRSISRHSSYEASKRALAKFERVDDMKDISGASSFIAGGIAGGISQFSVYPVDTLRLYFKMSTELIVVEYSAKPLRVVCADANC